MADLNDFLSLIEAARDLETDVERLIRYVARGELAIAVQAWMAIFADSNFDPQAKSPKQHVEHWLSNHSSELSGNAKDRIATLVNPETAKIGGAPRTPVN